MNLGSCLTIVFQLGITRWGVETEYPRAAFDTQLNLALPGFKGDFNACVSLERQHVFNSLNQVFDAAELRGGETIKAHRPSS